MSPRYTVPMGQGWANGFGPSLANYALKTKGVGFDENLLGVGVATGVEYRAGALFAGADLRYHETEEKCGVDFSNWTLGLKLGVNF